MVRLKAIREYTSTLNRAAMRFLQNSDRYPKVYQGSSG